MTAARRWPAGTGTALNFLTVAVGSLIGIAIRSSIQGHPELIETVKTGIGLVTLGLALKLFLETKNLLIPAFSVALGGLIGTALGLGNWLLVQADRLQYLFHGGSGFSEGLILAFVVFCVGPLTLLGCLEDAIERKFDMLGVKSIMDGFTAIVFAAAHGWGIFASAFVLLIFQGGITALALPLRRFAKDANLLAEVSATGGVILMAVALKLLAVRESTPADFLPALVIAPLGVFIARRFGKLNLKLKKPSGDSMLPPTGE